MIAAPIKSNNQPEPTLSDVLKIVMRMNIRFDDVESLLESLYVAHVDHFKLTQDVQRRVVNLEHQTGDIQDALNDLTEAEARDAAASINHEERIVRLEKINNIKAVPPQHLAEIE